MKNLKKLQFLAVVILSITLMSCSNTEESITIKGTGASIEFVLGVDTMFILDSEEDVQYVFVRDTKNNIIVEGTGGPIHFLGDGQVVRLSGSQKGITYTLITITDVEYKLKEYSLTPLVDHYCTGDIGGSLSLSGSNLGVTYELYLYDMPTGYSITGTGAGIIWQNILRGQYTCLATDNKTGISRLMIGKVMIFEDALPIVYELDYINDKSSIVLKSSNLGISYELHKDYVPTGIIVRGTGNELMFLIEGDGEYTIEATDITTGCSTFMSMIIEIALEINI